MQKLLEGEDEILSILRQQLETVSVTKREMTGAGFYVTFSVSSAARRIPDKQSFKFGDVMAEFPGVNHGAGFLVYVQDGFLDMLEGYAYNEPWPREVSNFKLSFTGGDRRDLQALRKILHEKKSVP